MTSGEGRVERPIFDSLGRTRREQILDAALRLFGQRGYEGTSMSEIAQTLGMSKAGLYHHFRTKDDILHALLDPQFDQVEALLDRYQPGPEDPTAQRRLLEEYFDLLHENSEVIGLLGTDMAVLSHPEFGPRTIELNERLTALVAGPEADLETRIRAVIALGALQVTAIRFNQEDPVAVRRESLRAATRVLYG